MPSQRIDNPRSYRQHLLREVPLVLLGAGVCAWAAVQGYSGPAVGVAVLGLLALGLDRHTQSLTLTDEQVSLTYYQRLTRHQVTWPLAEVSVNELRKAGGLLGNQPLYELRISNPGLGRTLTLSTADGFREEQLLALHAELTGFDEEKEEPEPGADR
ncbi:hypothetical protein B0919_10430 [Hymenobacter sp. CRA2]|nr:hypothetical protein B0919_10430 [Hymenobacter sp. CRA2]